MSELYHLYEEVKSWKKKVIIEEVISQTFEVELNDEESEYDQVRKLYIDGKLVVEDPSLTQANVMIYDENGEETDWSDLHV